MADETDAMLLSLIEKEIPDGRNALMDSHNNLAVLSNYCRDNYANSADKTKALEETKAYASQSLASVAYQIHSLAVNILQMMDQQTIQLQKMQSNANNTGLIVDIHKEKVARREIGVLTSSKNFSRSHKIVAPQQQEKPQRYKREEIDYSVLDHVGHGVKTDKSNESATNRRPSTSSSSGSVNQSGAISLSSVHSSSQGSLKNPQGSLYQSVSSNSTTKLRMMDNSMMSPRPPVAPVAPVAPTSPRDGAPKHVPTAPPPVSIGDDLPMPPPAPMFQIPTRDYDHDDTSQLPPPPPDLDDLYQIPTNNAAVDDLPPPPPELDDFSAPTSAMPPPPLPSAGDSFAEKVIAIYDYHKLRDDELELAEGDIVSVIKKNDDGWFEGVKDGIQGLFPGNYVTSF